MSNIKDSRKAHVHEPPTATGAEQTLAEKDYSTVPVQVENVVRVLSQKAADPAYDIYASYRTAVIVPGAVVQLLPQDELRLQAMIRVLNANVVICRGQAEAQSAGNIQATTGTTNFPPTPQGLLVSPGSNFPAFDNNETMWAVNCDPTLTAYVSVAIERGH